MLTQSSQDPKAENSPYSRSNHQNQSQKPTQTQQGQARKTMTDKMNPDEIRLGESKQPKIIKLHQVSSDNLQKSSFSDNDPEKKIIVRNNPQRTEDKKLRSQISEEKSGDRKNQPSQDIEL